VLYYAARRTSPHSGARHLRCNALDRKCEALEGSGLGLRNHLRWVYCVLPRTNRIGAPKDARLWFGFAQIANYGRYPQVESR
jgi:hypothetical protein